MKLPDRSIALSDGLILRQIRAEDSIAELTALLHRSYARLADMGLRFMATHQTEAVTLERINQGECYVAISEGQLVGTIIFKPAERSSGSPWLDLAQVASLAQFAVSPDLQAQGLGGRLMDFVEQRALETGAQEIALDTAEPAKHLVEWYGRRGYRIIEHIQWGHTNYGSVIMSKSLEMTLQD